VSLQKKRHSVPPRKIPDKNKGYRGALLKKIQGEALLRKKSGAWTRRGARRRPGSPKQDVEGWKANPPLPTLSKNLCYTK